MHRILDHFFQKMFSLAVMFHTLQWNEKKKNWASGISLPTSRNLSKNNHLVVKAHVSGRRFPASIPANHEQVRHL